MSLIPVSSNKNWVVVLKDSTRKSLVFYNQASHALALVNDPWEFNLYEQYEYGDISSSRNIDSIGNFEPENIHLNSNQLVTYSPGETNSTLISSVSENPNIHNFSEYPSYYNRFTDYEYDNKDFPSYDDFRDYSTRRASTSILCPECGAFISTSRFRHSRQRRQSQKSQRGPLSQNQPRVHKSHRASHGSSQQRIRRSSDQGAGPSTTVHVNPTPVDSAIVRDASYFRLLEGFTPVNENIEHVVSTEGVSRPTSNGSEQFTRGPQYSTISSSALSEGYFERFFRTVKHLGKGSRGSVDLVEHLLDGYSLGLFALKKVPVGDDHKWLEKVLAEVNLLRLLSHPNLVNYNHMWLENSQMSRFSPKVPCAFILQEFCDGGTLEDYVNGFQKEARLMKLRKELEERSKIKRKGKGKKDEDAAKRSSAQAKRERVRRATLGENQSDRSYDESNKSHEDDQIIPEARLSLNEILSFSRDIFAGVAHLHRAQIIHRDLKPSNCLLLSSKKRKMSQSFTRTSTVDEIPITDQPDNTTEPNQAFYQRKVESPFPTILVSDFGEGQREGISRTGTGTTGTLEYCAPELIAANTLNVESTDPGKNDAKLAQFSRKTDMFSLGMILHFLVYSCLPYPSAMVEGSDALSVNKLKIAVSGFGGYNEQNIPTAAKRNDLPEEITQLLKGLLSRNPNERPEAEECLAIFERLLQDQGIPNDPTPFNDTTNGKEDDEPVSPSQSIESRKWDITFPQNPRASIRLISDISIADARYKNYYPVYNESFMINKFSKDNMGIDLATNGHGFIEPRDSALNLPKSDAEMINVPPHQGLGEDRAVSLSIDPLEKTSPIIEPVTTTSAVVPFASPEDGALVPRQSLLDIVSQPDKTSQETFESEAIGTGNNSQIEEVDDKNMVSNFGNSDTQLKSSISNENLPETSMDKPTKLGASQYLPDSSRPGSFNENGYKITSKEALAFSDDHSLIQRLLHDKYRHTIPPRPTSIIGHSVPSGSTNSSKFHTPEESRAPSNNVSRTGSSSMISPGKKTASNKKSNMSVTTSFDDKNVSEEAYLEESNTDRAKRSHPGFEFSIDGLSGNDSEGSKRRKLSNPISSSSSANEMSLITQSTTSSSDDVRFERSYIQKISRKLRYGPSLNLILVKALLFALKAYTIQEYYVKIQSNEGITQKLSPQLVNFLVLLLGIEIPITDLRTTLVFFIIHMGIVLKPSLMGL